MFKRTRISTAISLTVISSLPLVSQSLLAQEGAVIEEIIVEAQRREQNLQDTPLSVTAFTGNMIEELGFQQSVDIAAQTPNFNVGYPNGETGIPAIFIRGVGVSDFRVFSPAAIAPYADEVYVAQSAGQIFQLLDMERIEMLRGPQGTLYGRNATGGAVNYVARKPTDEFEADLRINAGEFGYTSFEGAAGGPISDTLGYRLSVLKTDSDGWMDNLLTGNDQQGIDELAYRALIEWDPSDSVNVLFNFHGGKTESDAVQYRHLGLFDAVGEMCSLGDIRAGLCADAFGYSENQPFTTADGTVIPAATAYDEGSYNVEAKNDTEFWGASVKLQADIGDMVFTSITAFDDLDDSRPEETDASPNELLSGVLGVEQETFSQEFRLSQQRDGWNWIAGAYYLDDEANDRTGFSILGDLRPFFIGVDDADFCGDGMINPPPGNPNGFCPAQFVGTSASRTTQTITSFSLYSDASIDLNDDVRLNIGLRYTDEEVEHDVLQIYDEEFLTNNVRLAANGKTDFDSVSGRAVLDWQYNDNVMFYGGVSTGFKAGGIDSTVDGIVPYDSEELINYEVGFKTTLSDQSIRFNGALFHYDYTDLQVFTFIVVGAQTFSVLSNASDADLTGGELELQWLPTPNTFINLGLGFLDSEYKDFVDTVTGDDFSGNQIVMSPDLTYNGLIQHDFPLGGGNGTLTAQLDFTYQDEVFFDAQNSPLLSEDSYTLYNARLAWRSADENTEIALWGRNLGDEEYMVYAFDLSFLGFNEEMIGAPRMIGVSATFGF
ncbi:MAG: TonB-dependent receptor [Pseudomonadales bacterium]|nr:TonB-dependent receptor [Pseudomonadales bacterium]